MTPEQSPENEKTKSTKHGKKCLWTILIVIFVSVLGILFWRISVYKSVDEQLAAIEAARAIPDSENAAIIYNKLLGYTNNSMLTFNFTDDEEDILTRNRPWTRSEFPNLTKWLEERQDIIEELIRASKIDQCRFPIDFPIGPGPHGQRLTIMRQWLFLLVRSANNDIAEGRIDKALKKYFCIIHIGRHNRQQPVAIDFLVGNAMESQALQRLRFCIMQSDLTEEHFQAIETAISQSDDEQKQQWNNMLAVQKLHTRKTPLLERLKEWIRNWRNQTFVFEELDQVNKRFLADRQGTQILIALRQFKNKTEHWPESLDELMPLVDKNILIDPQNNGPFAYKLLDNGFTLYSIGPNKIDENRSNKKGADDRAIWP
jgi:hypothetical protein